ncbi:MAG: hypothetical protein EBZ77_08015, partial [Chitinophagia bacterium]|nr:hypothetical protein [Chitinophagia bacterium]
MKRFLLAVMVLTFAAGAALGQTDGIYSDGDEQRSGADQQSVAGRRQSPGNDANGNNNTYTQGGEVYNDYDNPDDYIDNSESYSSRINRFNYGFYNMGYYSMFYNPFWYSPTWYDPYWGYNPWRRGFTVSFGWGYPGWGWNTWLGYPAWSCWGGGFGYGCGYGYGWGSYYSPLAYTGYYGGYWNRVYAYNNDTRPYGSATYGIRRQGQISQVSGNGVRSSGSGLKQMPDANTRPYAFTRPDQGL